MLNELMSTGSVTFGKQLGGYDKQQVNRYIKMLSDAYQDAYEKYTAISGKYSSLLKAYGQIRKESERSKTSIDAITKTLIDAELMAQNIVANAQEEAGRIKAGALSEAEKIRSVLSANIYTSRRQ